MGSLDQVLLAPSDECALTVLTTVTSTVSPELRGRAPRLATTVDVTVDGNLYVATASNGIWILPAGTITPNLAAGTYYVSLSALCKGEIVTDRGVDELTITTGFWIHEAGDDHIWELGDLAEFDE